MIRRWTKLYIEHGGSALQNKKKPGNPLTKYSRRKTLSKEEQLEYENMKLRIENELLKKGYLMKGDGTIVKFMK
jgi:transposase-like protein